MGIHSNIYGCNQSTKIGSCIRVHIENRCKYGNGLFAEAWSVAKRFRNETYSRSTPVEFILCARSRVCVCGGGGGGVGGWGLLLYRAELRLTSILLHIVKATVKAISL